MNPLEIGKGAVLPMIPDSWRYGFRKTAEGFAFGAQDDGPLVAWDAVKDAVAAAPAQSGQPVASNKRGLAYATSLAVSLHRAHYAAQAPDWKPLDDLYGVLSQIDNMLTGWAPVEAQAAAAWIWCDALTQDHCHPDDLTAIAEGWEPLYRRPHAALTRDAVQQKAVNHGFKYWRASDAHGVTATNAQAVELLQDLLGVEVEIEPAKGATHE
jgi:hypothetical protein